MNSRDTILNKLRAARRPFEDAPPRPKDYLDVTLVEDTSAQGLLERFTREMVNLKGEVFPVVGNEAACQKVMELLRSHDTRQLIAWDFQHIPVDGLEQSIRSAGVEILIPETHDEFRDEMVQAASQAQVGLTGVDAAAAATGTLIVSTAPGKGRMPTVLAPVHIAVMTLDQLVPRIESWVAQQRAQGLATMQSAANICFITGPSRTGDIEMEIVLGVHGPAKLQVVVKQ